MAFGNNGKIANKTAGAKAVLSSWNSQPVYDILVCIEKNMAAARHSFRRAVNVASLLINWNLTAPGRDLSMSLCQKYQFLL